MAPNRSHEQVKEEHIARLGPELGTLYNSLYNEIVWLHAKWEQFRLLYTKREHVELLNRVSGSFFRVVQDVFWQDVVLHVARLTDPTSSMGHDNLTLLRLAPAIEDGPLAAEIGALVEDVRGKSTFARQWRNRKLAHRDLDLALKQSAKPLPPLRRKDIEASLSAIAAVLRRIEDYYWGSDMHLSDLLGSGDAKSLLYCLEQAVKAEDCTRERIKRGIVTPEDLSM